MCHVETHIEGVTHVCNICSKTFKTRNSLDKHKYTYHKGEHKQLTQTNATIFQSCIINCVWKINPLKLGAELDELITFLTFDIFIYMLF